MTCRRSSRSSCMTPATKAMSEVSRKSGSSHQPRLTVLSTLAVRKQPTPRARPICEVVRRRGTRPETPVDVLVIVFLDFNVR